MSARFLETDISGTFLNHSLGPSDFKSFGKVGERNYLQGLPTGSDGYQVLLANFEPTEEEKQIEEALAPLFPHLTGRMKPRNWTILEDGTFKIEDQSAIRNAQRIAGQEGKPHKAESPSLYIPPEALQQDTLSPVMTEATLSLLGIEARADEYTKWAFLLFDGIPTLKRFYHGWDADESFHPPALELIAVQTRGATQDQVDRYLEQVSRRRWIPPFRTIRQMLIFPYPQEKTTGPSYGQYISAIQETASNSAGALKRTVKPDEDTHGVGFEKIITALGILSPKDTAEDIFYVFERFTMPGDAILPDPERAVLSFRALGIDRRFIARILYQCLETLNNNVSPHLGEGEQFLDMARARDLVCFYAKSRTGEKDFQILMARNPRIRPNKQLERIGGKSSSN